VKTVILFDCYYYNTIMNRKTVTNTPLWHFNCVATKQNLL